LIPVNISSYQADISFSQRNISFVAETHTTHLNKYSVDSSKYLHWYQWIFFRIKQIFPFLNEIFLS